MLSRRSSPFFIGLAIAIAVGACAHATGSVGAGGTAGAGGSTTKTTTTTVTTVTSVTATTGSGMPPTSCAGANDMTGCCAGSVLWYCDSTGAMKSKDCGPLSMACGWYATKSYYGCVPPPATTDPSGKYPITCM